MKHYRFLLVIVSMLSISLSVNVKAVNYDADSPAPEARSSQNQVFFNISSSDINLLNVTNIRELSEFRKIVDNPNAIITQILITGHASPDGNTFNNGILAEERSEQLKEYLQISFPTVSPDIIKTTSRVIRWHDVAVDLRKDNNLPYKQDVLAVLNAATSHEEKEVQIRRLHGGEPFEYLKEILPQYRFGNYLISWYEKEVAEIKNTTEMLSADETINLVEAITKSTQETELIESPPDIEEMGIVRNKSILLKTNALYLAGTVLNAGAEFRLSPKISLDVPVYYSPYSISDDFKVRVLGTQPELRYWFGETFDKGHFMGVHGHIASFDVALGDRKYRESEKATWGAGISYGYNVPFKNDRWSMEFTVGAGYTSFSYALNEGKDKQIRRKNFWGPSRAGVSFGYKIR